MKEKQIGTALLSYGMSGEVFHAPLLDALPQYKIESVLQRNPSKQRRHSYPVVYNFDEILRNEAIDLVVVNTPNDSHFDYAKRSLEAGKHVVVEKPFTVTSAEAESLISIASQNKRVLSVFQNRRWDGGFLTIRKLLEEKLLGRLVEAEFHYDRFRNHVDVNSWKEKDAPGTGILYNLGSHMIDQAVVLFGLPKAVDARIGVQRTGARADDYYDIRFEYDQLNVIIKSSYLVREPGPMYKLHGTEGSFIKYGIDPQEEALKRKEIPGTPRWGSEDERWWGKINTSFNGLHLEGRIGTVPGNYLTYYQQLSESILSKAELPVKPEESLGVIRLIEASIESNRTRKAVFIR